MAVSNVRIIANDGHKDAVLTATSEALVIDNTKDSRRAYPWRSEDTSPGDWWDQTITAIMPVSILGLGGLVLSNTNLTLDATVSVVLKSGMTTIDTVTPVCLGANLDGTTTWVAWFTAGPIDQYELTIDDSTNPDGYLQIVQIICGPVLTPANNPAYGLETEWLEDVQHITTAGQSIRSEGTGIVRRAVTMSLEVMTEADRTAIIEGLIAAGQKSTLFLSVYPGEGGDLENQHQFACRRVTNLKPGHWTINFWRDGVEFREV